MEALKSPPESEADQIVQVTEKRNALFKRSNSRRVNFASGAPSENEQREREKLAGKRHGRRTGSACRKDTYTR